MRRVKRKGERKRDRVSKRKRGERERERKKRPTATKRCDEGKEKRRGSLLLNEKLDRACRNAIFRRIHLVETFLPREKIQSNPEGESERASERANGRGGRRRSRCAAGEVVVVLAVRTRERQLGSKIDREIQEIQRVVGCQNKVFAK